MAHFAPQAEQEWFAKQLDEEQAFYRCWCLREAVLKSQGVGIVKLSSVVHLPERLQIFSDYCPKGELIFTDEIAFLLCGIYKSVKNSTALLSMGWKKFSRKKYTKTLDLPSK